MDSTQFFKLLGNKKDVMRQYEALKSLDYIKPNLKKAIFCDAKDGFAQKPSISTSLPPSPTKPSSVIAQVWDIISKQTNAYQLSAIENIMSGKAKENITLLQGPPGKLQSWFLLPKFKESVLNNMIKYSIIRYRQNSHSSSTCECIIEWKCTHSRSKKS